MEGWRNSRKTSVSESEQGDGRELVSEQWAMGVCGMEAIRWSRAEEGCHLMWELRDFSDSYCRGDRRSS